MTTRFKLPVVPAAFFGIVLGLAGLAFAWRAAQRRLLAQAAAAPPRPEVAAGLLP